MESSNASSWLMNFETDYSSFFHEFGQFDGLVSSLMIPEFSTPSPGDCLSNSSSNLNESPQVDALPPPSESALPNVDVDQAKKKRRLRNNGGNCSSAKGKNGIDKEASTNSDCIDNSNNLGSKGGRGRKRTYEETVEGNKKNSNNSSVDPAAAVEPKLPNRRHHVIAERKRREKLMQHFIALSSLVPGLTRMDKASVLADAIRYVKQLQERVRTLETEATQKNAQAAVIIKKSQSMSPDECNSSTTTTCGDVNSQADELSTKAGPPPEIEVRISEQRVLIKIHCESQKGVLVKALSQIESLGLAVVSTTVVPFTSSTLDITITAKVDHEELSLTGEDLIKRLNFALKCSNSSA